MLNANAENRFAGNVVWSHISQLAANVLRNGIRRIAMKVKICNGLSQTPNNVPIARILLKKMEVVSI